MNGSRDAINEGFSRGIIIDGEGWMNMFKDRNRASHTYNQNTAKEIVYNILNLYFNLFYAFQEKMQAFLNSDITKLF
jgi:nucleotidyltransferase substrate binding protein (TIGR01987 family)